MDYHTMMSLSDSNSKRNCDHEENDVQLRKGLKPNNDIHLIYLIDNVQICTRTLCYIDIELILDA